MVHLKKLVMQGFKSFARRTEIPFGDGINVIIGPNGSGKSNISDALCFALGRISMKSMRASKASNLIFMGGKGKSPMREAFVELFFDNSDRKFSINSDEIIIRRAVRLNGQSSYRINGNLQTRQDILSILAQAGIDPKGFNIVLQGEIGSFIKIPADERRKVIEEVAGISIYESRKEKSLKELEKTEEKLKEVTAILRERTTYLKNLEKERSQALRFKGLEKVVRRCKASILSKNLEAKEKEFNDLNKEISSKDSEIEKLKTHISVIQKTIFELRDEINKMTNQVQKSSGLEQESVRKEIAMLRADLAGLNVKKENHENRFNESVHREDELKKNIKNYELEIQELKEKSPALKNKHEHVEKKKKEFESLEEKRKNFYSIETDLRIIREKIKEKKESVIRFDQESDTLISQSKKTSEDLLSNNYDDNKKVIDTLKLKLKDFSSKIEELDSKELELERISATRESEMERLENMKSDISKLDICPLCKSKITQDHIKKIGQEADPKIQNLNKDLGRLKTEIFRINQEQINLKDEIERVKLETSKREIDSVKLRNLEEVKQRIKSNFEHSESLKKQIFVDEQKQSSLEKSYKEFSEVEEKYENARIDLEEISSRNDLNIDTELSFKQRELERIKVIIKTISRDEKILSQEIKEITEQIQEKTSILKKREKQDEELNTRFKNIFDKKNSLNEKINNQELESVKLNEQQKQKQDLLNNLRINLARIDAEKENILTESKEYADEEVIQISKDNLIKKLNQAQIELSQVGSVNLRALEVYDEIKNEYDEIYKKVEIIEKEKVDIMKIVELIDQKKKRTFMKTLKSINELFTKNFSQLSTKGIAFIDLENKEDPFAGGLNVLIKVGNGKFMDIHSLSGGEQTLVALSLIFAIQEYNPYCFYILDEIDAALDKRNAERLANLLKKYIKKGQYIIVSHNDALMIEATHLYGVSMQEGISKIISLKLDQELKSQENQII